MSTTLIQNGTVVSATGRVAADVLIDSEAIAAVLAPGSELLGADLPRTVDQVIDAAGKYVVPGEIDAHTHMEMPFGGTNASDTFETGTRAAAFGGTTIIVDFITQYPDQNVLDQYHLWQALRTNDLQMVSTNHCPFCMNEQKERDRGNFSKIPNGFGTVEHRMDLLFQGDAEGRITLERWVEITSTTPARMFGMYGRKGVIQPGADADIVVYDPNGHTTVSAATHHMNLDYPAWEGFQIDGKVDTVLSRGKVIVDSDRYLGRLGDGRFLARGTSQYLI